MLENIEGKLYISIWFFKGTLSRTLFTSLWSSQTWAWNYQPQIFYSFDTISEDLSIWFYRECCRVIGEYETSRNTRNTKPTIINGLWIYYTRYMISNELFSKRILASHADVLSWLFIATNTFVWIILIFYRRNILRCA